jgi:hypothetical protein
MAGDELQGFVFKAEKGGEGKDAFKASKSLLLIAGALLIYDAILVAAGTPNPLLRWPLPWPVTLTLLGAASSSLLLAARRLIKGNRVCLGISKNRRLPVRLPT